ncbi:S-adenosyl methyltransferase [Streptomyces jeddahensis]|uniref:S-adenosyl methyltransferase n=1 Tax=Streptomyces jeddahensis TaxID=1716141 RepID=A0A177HZL4_9ACTN|nr:S-adenosyl methyltransferase [Streptomyces jeddahensis]
MYKARSLTMALCSHAEVVRFFDGMELVEPGVVVPTVWHPELGDPVPGQDDGAVPGYAGVARKR